MVARCGAVSALFNKHRQSLKHVRSKFKLGKALLFVAGGVVIFALGFGSNAYFWRYDLTTSGLISRSGRPDLTQFWNVYDVLHQKYDGKIDNNTLIEGAIKGEAAALNDPYTVYLDANDAKDLANELSGSLSGIGVEVGIKNNDLVVIAPIDGTPAAKAGLKAGDIIAAINGADTSSFTLDQAVGKIRGTAGTEVKLTIVRGTATLNLTLTRANITVKSVDSSMVAGQDGIGLIRIREFGDDTTAGIKAAVASLKSQGARGVIIDLRDNPGGYLQSAVDSVSQFMNSGKVVEERGTAGDNQTYYAEGNAPLANVPIVILVNGGTASAAEIMSGALHDSGRATLIGQKTFGKGVVQEVINLAGGTQLKVTVAKWYTPNGTNISHDGINPDIKVASATDAQFVAGVDPQMDQALVTLKSKL